MVANACARTRVAKHETLTVRRGEVDLVQELSGALGGDEKWRLIVKRSGGSDDVREEAACRKSERFFFPN